MEFFEWMGITQAIFTFIAGAYLKEDTLELAQRNARLGIISGLIAGAVLFALSLVLGGVGLYKMAKKKGMKHTWLAFIPFANTYYAGCIAGEARVFGRKMKRAGLYAMLAEIVYVGFSILTLVADVLLIPYYGGTTVTSAYDPTYSYTSFGPLEGKIPASMRWMYTATYALDGFGWAYILSSVAYIVFLAFLGISLSALFKQYNPRGYMGLLVLCILFPVRGFVFFALRNRTAIDYDEYMRRRMDEFARRQQQYGPYGPYGQPPYGQPPYGNQPYGQQPPQDEPFSDFGGTQGGNGQADQSGQSGQGSTPPPANDSPFSDF